MLKCALGPHEGAGGLARPLQYVGEPAALGRGQQANTLLDNVSIVHRSEIFPFMSVQGSTSGLMQCSKSPYPITSSGSESSYQKF